MKLEKVGCVICGKTKNKKFLEINNWQLTKCLHCGLVYLNPRPTPEELKLLYQNVSYVEKRIGYQSEVDLEKISKKMAGIDLILQYINEPGRLLEVGCGQGYFLAAAEQRGFEVVGIDISSVAIGFAREKLDLRPTYVCALEEFHSDYLFDVVVMLHVLEHLPNPLIALHQVYNLLKPGGILLIGVPNLDSFDRRWHGKRWSGYDLPYHLYHFSPKTITKLLQKTGFKIEQIELTFFHLLPHLKLARKLRSVRADTIDFTSRSEVEKTFISWGGRKVKGFIKLFLRPMLVKIFSDRKMTIIARKK